MQINLLPRKTPFEIKGRASSAWTAPAPFCIATFLTALLVSGASALECSPDDAWGRVRQAYPIHVQTIASCRDPSTGKSIVIVTEPPPHVIRTQAEPIIRALFSTPLISVERRRHTVGFDGWTEDLVIVADTRSDDNRQRLSDDLAALATLVFGSAYKAEVENVFNLAAPPPWGAPPRFEVSKDELFNWLLGSDAEKLVSTDGGGSGTLEDHAGRQDYGTYYTMTPGVVVALLPRMDAGILNDHVATLRQFFVDTDALLGAIKIGGSCVALVGRERTSPVTTVQPLRVETALLLASQRNSRLAQSYERKRAFAGKLLTNTPADFFGWDWAPVLLSDTIIDTEFGSLLNFTDDMLKAWSESGHVSYRGFEHTYPDRYPFGADGALKTVGTKNLVYNWNTAGLGFINRIDDGTEIFSIRNTGSLPVSYFPESSEDSPDAKQKLVSAEDESYRYFSSLRNPMLQRAVQYSALYQIVQAFDMRAAPPHGLAPRSASIEAVEDILAKHVSRALAALTVPDSPTNDELLLESAYSLWGPDVQMVSPLKQTARTRQKLNSARTKFAADIAELDLLDSQWRDDFVGFYVLQIPPLRQSPSQANIFNELGEVGIRMALAPEAVREDIVSSLVREPEGWIRTPSIVVSRINPSLSDIRSFVGGHNISGRATRVVIDPSIAKGDVSVGGSYEDGRIIRISPQDAGTEGDLVRTFDREVGLDDRNFQRGARALRSRLREMPNVARPVRPIVEALEIRASAAVRGAQPNPKAIQIGFHSSPEKPVVLDSVASRAIETRADIVVAPEGEGYVVFRSSPPPPSRLMAPNATSLHQALNSAVQRVAKGPPTVTMPKVVFNGLKRADVVRHVESIARKMEAVASAGGKPPFGGNGKRILLADGPEPERGLTSSEMDGNPPPPPDPPPSAFENFWRRLPIIGKLRARLSVSRAQERSLALKPNWSDATVRVLDEDMLLVDLPSFKGSMHVVEVTVPVPAAAGAPKSLFVRAVSWFSEPPAQSRIPEINASVYGIFKTAASIDVEEALIQYKTIMIQTFGAQHVNIMIRDEGSDIVITSTDPRLLDPFSCASPASWRCASHNGLSGRGAAVPPA